MDLIKLNEIKKLKRDSETLRNLTATYIATKAKSQCDKHGLSFKGDDRFSIFRARVVLSGWSGYYGSSSCSTLVSLCLGEKEIQSAFDEALERNMSAILESMANVLLEKARNGVAEATKEIQKASDLLAEITA